MSLVDPVGGATVVVGDPPVVEEGVEGAVVVDDGGTVTGTVVTGSEVDVVVCPTVDVVAGSRGDPTTPPHAAMASARTIPTAILRLISDLSHLDAISPLRRRRDRLRVTGF
jgi:hypothetical protein